MRNSDLKNMKRKTSTTPTRIWSFHALAPTLGAESVRDILFRQNRYYNKMIEVERDRIDDYQQIRRFYAPELAALETAEKDAQSAVEETIEAIAKWRAQQFIETGKKLKKTPPTLVLVGMLTIKKEELKQARVRTRECKQAFEALLGPAREEFARRKKSRGEGVGPRTKSVLNADVLREMLSEDWPEAWRELAQCDDAAHDRSLKARAECELPTGCYLLVEQAAQKAIQDSRPAPPRFRRFDGGGRIGVQIIGAPTVATLSAGTMFRLQVTETKRSGQYGVASIRIGSNADRSPIWAEFPVRLHRPLPTDGIAKWAWIKVTREGPRIRYELQITLEAPSFAEDRIKRGRGRVAVNFGWCRQPTGIRVAYWVSDDGEHGEIVIPDALVLRLTRPESLRSHADRYRDGAYRLVRVVSALAGSRLTHASRCVSDVRREQIKRMARAYSEYVLGERRIPLWEAWKQDRSARPLDFFASLPESSRWLRKRVPGCSASMRWAFWLELWTRKDSHLRSMESAVTVGARNARDELLRESALVLARRFGYVVIDNASIADMVRVPAKEGTDAQTDVARSQRALVAPGRFREIVKEVFGKHTITVESKDNTARCAECANPLEIENRFGRCTCGVVIDIDRNNCLNLLRRERSGGDESSGAARSPMLSLDNASDGAETISTSESAAE